MGKILAWPPSRAIAPHQFADGQILPNFHRSSRHSSHLLIFLVTFQHFRSNPLPLGGGTFFHGIFLSSLVNPRLLVRISTAIFSLVLNTVNNTTLAKNSLHQRKRVNFVEFRRFRRLPTILVPFTFRLESLPRTNRTRYNILDRIFVVRFFVEHSFRRIFPRAVIVARYSSLETWSVRTVGEKDVVVVVIVIVIVGRARPSRPTRSVGQNRTAVERGGEWIGGTLFPRRSAELSLARSPKLIHGDR